MDKFFIQNAFKTLDEIEEEMTKEKSLTESLVETKAKPEGDKIASYNAGLKLAKEKNKPVIYGYSNNRLNGKFFKLDDPIVCDDIVKCQKDFRNQYKNCSVVFVAYPDKEFVEQESLNEDLTLDVDELSDKYVGLTCNINSEESDYNNEIGTIKSLVDYEGDFSNSVWEVILNIGISLNVLGSDLEINLQEKLPHDLARAYKYAPSIFRKSVDKDTNRILHTSREFFPKDMLRRGVTIDFENSNYKEISKEEALKYSKAPLRSKLRVLYSRTYGDPMVMMWDENNVPITKPQEFERYMDYGENPFTFKNIINHADKIYVTDEDEHKIVRDEPIKPDDEDSKFLDYSNEINGWSSQFSPMEVNARSAVVDRYNRDSKKLGDIDDTGDHSKGYRGKYSYQHLMYDQKRYDKLLKELSGKTLNDADKKDLDRLRMHLKNSQIDYLKDLSGIKEKTEPNRLKPLMNMTLADLIILKYALKREQKNFQKAENNATADLRYHQYIMLTDDLKRLEDKLKDIQARIAEVKNQLTPELEQEYRELQEEKLFDIGDKFQEILDKLNKLRKDSGLKVEESLKEELECETHLRIYTQNESGYEDFIDGPTPTSEWSSEEEALAAAEELAKDGDYEHVCLVRIEYCPEINDEEVTILFDSYDLEESLKEDANRDTRSIGEIVDDILETKNESLNESKSLDLDPATAARFTKAQLDKLTPEEIKILQDPRNREGRDKIIAKYNPKHPLDEDAVLRKSDQVCSVVLGDKQVFTGTKEECENFIKTHESAASRAKGGFKLLNTAEIYVNESLKAKTTDKLCSVVLNGRQYFVGTKEECEKFIKNHESEEAARRLGGFKLLNTAEIYVNESLNESKSFNLKDESDIVDAAAYKKIGEETPEQLVVVDPSIESTDDDFEPHAGDAILQCRECKTIIFQRTTDLVKDGDTDIYNKETPCPHCGAHSGFNYLYQAADKNSAVTEDEEEVIETSEPTENKEETSLPPVESDFISLDNIDNIQEESFERLVNPYLVKLYENIKEFKTTSVIQEGFNGFRIKGKLIGNTGKEKLVEFLFTIKENNATSIVLEGYNKLLTED